MQTNRPLTATPCAGERTFLDFPLQLNPEALSGGFAFLGVPFGKPYPGADVPNDQSLAPDALRRASSNADIRYTRNHYDFDLGGDLLDGRDVAVVDCGNVCLAAHDWNQHYEDAGEMARAIYRAGTRLIAVGGDHGVTIPLLRALEVLNTPVTLVHVDAHLDWRDDIDGQQEGYSSPIRRASEMPFVKDIVQIGMRGIGSARQAEVDAARRWGAQIIDAYELDAIGMDAVLARIPAGGPYYLSIDADGVDPTLMPGVIAPTPGGLNWVQLWKLVHGLTRKGPIVGLDLVEIAPGFDVRGTTLINAERLLCNYIGASVRSEHAPG